MESGSLAEWVGGLGTVAAFAGAVVVWVHELTLRRRSLAEQLILKVDYIQNVATNIVTCTITYSNLGQTPIHFVMVGHNKTRFDTSWGYIGLMRVPVYLPVIDPGESSTFTFSGNVPSTDRIFVSFKDGKGRNWYQLLRKGQFRFISHWRYEQLSMPPKWFLKMLEKRVK
jgi:hypothetical protein